MPTPLRQAWSTPLGLDAPLEELLAGTTSEELRGMLAALGVKPPGTKQQRIAALVEHHSDAKQVAALVAKAPTATRKLLEQSARSTARSQCSSGSGLLAATSNRARDGHSTAHFWSRTVTATARPYAGRSGACSAGPRGTLRSNPCRLSHGWCPSPPAEVDREAGGRGHRVRRPCRLGPFGLLGRPPARLKSGGIGARELARLGKAAQADDAVVRITLEPRTLPDCWPATAITYIHRGV